MRRWITPFRIIAAGFLLAACVSWGQANGNRLILKDGSYQVITKYEVRGNRVRFYSAERHDWEEIPENLVDWTATAKWNHENGVGGQSVHAAPNPTDPGQIAAAKIDAEEKAARTAELQRMPYVMPGLRLPNESGIWVLDTYNGQPELAHMTQANGDLNRAYEHSVKPYEAGSKRGSREVIQINGYAAPVELHVAQPVFYVSLDHPKGSPQPVSLSTPLTVDTLGAGSVKDDKGAVSSPQSRYVILALDVKPTERTARAAEVDAILSGGPPATDLTETTKEVLPGGYWMKITPKSPLLIGQYALIEVLSPKFINTDVWAFGVNPQAPDNQDTVGKVGGSH